MWTFQVLSLVVVAISSTSASSDTVESLVMPGKVIAGHAELEGQCRKCHQPFHKEGQNLLCLDCHKDIGRDVAAKTGFHGRVTEKPCRECHTEHLGRQANIVKLEEATFDHRQTDFLLLGRHASVKCAACHLAGKKFRQTPRDCESCHVRDDVHKGSLGADCERCHVEADWKKTKFDHDKTHFALRGMHVRTRCAACHRTANFKEAPKDCAGCHRRDDIHQGKLGADCSRCHNDRGWKKVDFDHAKTQFPLSGGHVAVKCVECHRDRSFKGAPTACNACHAKNDVHKTALGPDCAKCHNDRDWKAATFDHGKTHFPLLGMHGKTRCSACHKSQSFNDHPPEICSACHSKNDVHRGRFSDKCGTCHGESSWKALKFEHERDTGFQLRQAHVGVACGACHTGRLYVDKTPADCNGCHAKKDIHRGGLGTRCETCHRESTWKSTTFDHAANTRYPLAGRHAAISCKSCHLDGSFSDKLKTECITCHRKDDKHANQEGPQCGRCHEESSWKRTNFDHARASFALTGQHLKVPCANCHASARFRDAKKECVACHAKQDAHKRRLGAACENCHNSRDWRIWDFDHDKRTHFALDGAHRKIVCVACHTKAADKLSFIGGRCIDCHEHDDVHHESFGTQCDRCHSTSTFKDARR